MIRRGRKIFRYVAAALCLSTLSISAIPPGGGGGDGGGGGGGGSPGWIAQYFVSGANAKVGKPVYLSWQSFYTVGCTVWSNQTGSKTVATSGSTTVTPTSASTMSVRLTCAGTNGQTTSQTRSFSVNRSDHPELVSFGTNLTAVDAGTPVTLSWTSQFSDYCKLTGAVNDTLPANGSRTVYPAQGNNIYFLECRKNDGRKSRQLSDSVVGRSPFPTINQFYVSGQNQNGYSLVWFANAEYCVLDGFTQPVNGTASFQAVGVPISHGLTCFKNGYSDSRAITVHPVTNGGGGPGPILIDDADEDGNQY